MSQFKRVEKADSGLAARIRLGDLPLDRAERIVRDREAEARRIQVAKDAPSPAEVRVDVRLGDFREVLANVPDGSVDAIITDPPYPKEYLPLLDDLATFADRVLKPDGILAVLFGQVHLIDAANRLSAGRPYRWTACYLTPGAAYFAHARKVHTNWKPLLVYGGGPTFQDVLRSEDYAATVKEHHPWAQDFTAFQTLVERLTIPGDLVIDPFMGSGTTLLAARSLGRHSLGCDVEPESVETARRRLGLDEPVEIVEATS